MQEPRGRGGTEIGSELVVFHMKKVESFSPPLGVGQPWERLPLQSQLGPRCQGIQKTENKRAELYNHIAFSYTPNLKVI